MILEVRDITKKFGGLQALTEVNFDLPPGQILGLIGPNGAGKTTLFNVLNGIFRPEVGRVIFRGEDITGLPPYEVARRGIARAYQVVRPLADLTVQENVMVGACFGQECFSLTDAAQVGGLLGPVGQSHLGQHFPGNLGRVRQGEALLAEAGPHHDIFLDG